VQTRRLAAFFDASTRSVTQTNIKGSKDSDSSLVSNENLSEILWPSGWALGQATWAKMAQKLLHLWRQPQKIHTPNQKIFFECNLLDCPIRLSPWTAL